MNRNAKMQLKCIFCFARNYATIFHTGRFVSKGTVSFAKRVNTALSGNTISFPVSSDCLQAAVRTSIRHIPIILFMVAKYPVMLISHYPEFTLPRAQQSLPVGTFHHADKAGVYVRTVEFRFCLSVLVRH